jgi:hypothetical protein
MELAYGRGTFSRYAVSGKDALEVLDGLVEEMETRKRDFAGRVRTIRPSTDYPLELLEFDEIGALTKYTDRKTRERIVERVALLNTQGRALNISVRGYVQEPTNDTVPVRELFTRRVCLRVTSKTHVGMVLGDGAYERGAWANRIGDSEAGVGFMWGEGIREPLRIRAGWVSDETVKALEQQYVTNGGTARPVLGGEGWRRELADGFPRCHPRPPRPPSAPAGGDADRADLVRPLTVQLAAHRLPDVAGALLTWANTLDDVAAQLWRTRDGRSVHLSVTGRTPCGIPVLVYGGVSHDSAMFPDLPAGARQDMPVLQLRQWSRPGEVAA